MRVFSDTSTYNGLVQGYENELGFDYGDVSGNAKRLKTFTVEANAALDEITKIAILASGTWQWDDNNHDDYPIVSTDLILGQKDYTITTDEGGNLVFDIAKVMVADQTGVFRRIEPKDPETQRDTSYFYDNQSRSGVATAYDKLANGVILNIAPNYNMRFEEEGVAGLKMYINRAAAYFTYTDTDTIPGIPGFLHDYLFMKPAMKYARINSLTNFAAIRDAVLQLEEDARTHFGFRTRDERKTLRPAYQNNK